MHSLFCGSFPQRGLSTYHISNTRTHSSLCTYRPTAKTLLLLSIWSYCKRSTVPIHWVALLLRDERSRVHTSARIPAIPINNIYGFLRFCRQIRGQYFTLSLNSYRVIEMKISYGFFCKPDSLDAVKASNEQAFHYLIRGLLNGIKSSSNDN